MPSKDRPCAAPMQREWGGTVEQLHVGVPEAVHGVERSPVRGLLRTIANVRKHARRTRGFRHEVACEVRRGRARGGLRETLPQELGAEDEHAHGAQA